MVGGLDYVVSTHIEKRGKRVGGPPAAETASKTLLRAGRGRAVKVVRHLRRMKAHATFWTFPLIEGRKKTAEVVVIVEARDEGEGPLGHTEVIRVLRGCGPGSPRNF
jgi:branched-subunit amino acid aminotransferase/4-amino-4-deoxychorismate lyase